MIDLKKAFEALKPHLNEKTRRLVAAALTLSNEPGLRSKVSQETGVSFKAIRLGREELKSGALSDTHSKKLRKSGGGRKKISERNPALVEALKQLVEPTTRGDPESPLLWTCKSLRNLANELNRMGFVISFSTVGVILEEMGYSLQANKKVLEGADHPDRDAQFNFIARRTRAFQILEQPIISIDCKKHELGGNYKNNGKVYCPKKDPIKVKDHDFMDKDLGKAIPYGVLDCIHNAGFVNVGVDHDTSVFAVESIRQWWFTMGSHVYPNASRLFIVADCGGSNGYRRKLWKKELANLATELNLKISVSHYPVGTSKWNKIEHRLFSHITMNWRGRPLITHEVIVKLIASTKTKTGLKVNSKLDLGKYPTGIKVKDEELKNLNIKKNGFHGEWNYTFSP